MKATVLIETQRNGGNKGFRFRSVGQEEEGWCPNLHVNLTGLWCLAIWQTSLDIAMKVFFRCAMHLN